MGHAGQSFLPGRTLRTDQALASPLENPTDADPAKLGYDFLILGFGPPALIAAGAGLIRSTRRTRRCSDGQLAADA